MNIPSQSIASGTKNSIAVDQLRYDPQKFRFWWFFMIFLERGFSTGGVLPGTVFSP
jgi:hypothetical protein